MRRDLAALFLVAVPFALGAMLIAKAVAALF